MIQQQLYQWIKHPECLNRETLFELRTLLARYPYFQTARLLYLKNLYLLHDITFGEELRRAALYVTDRRMLFLLVEGEKYALKDLKKANPTGENPSLDRTLSLIDAFLATLPEEQEKEILLPVEPVIDYSTYLMQDAPQDEPADAPKLKGQDWIDSFLEKSATEPLLSQPSAVVESEEKPLVVEEEKQTPVVEENEAEEEEAPAEILDDESYFTETLAKIYVKQQRYSKALEIIRRLNLKYPKKNAYFADQIRFLEKLIINAKSK